MNKTACNLQNCFLCQHCIPAWKSLIGLNKETKMYKKGKTIFREGEAVAGIYFVYSGWVKIHKQWTHPKELIVRFAGTGEIIGHRGLGDLKTYPVSATALEDTIACFVSEDFLESSLQTNPALTYRLMLFYAEELQKAEKRMRDMALMEVKGRLAGALLDIHNKFGINKEGYISIAISRQDIASYSGTTYETLFKLFNELIKDKLISTSGKYIKIKNTGKLQQLIMMK